MRIVLFTGEGRRHRFAARRLAATGALAGVVSEVKAPAVVAEERLSPSDRAVVQRHLAERDAVEARLLGEPAWPATERCSIATGEVNSAAVADWVRRRDPSMLVLFGAGILRAPLLEAYADRVINLHLGLSPYYRGSATNFWPLVEREPECVGSTIHLAVSRVDAGAILAQVRPTAEPTDRAHELGTKALLAALELLPQVLSTHAAGRLTPAVQDLSLGRVFRRADFGAEAVCRMWRNLETGMMAEYVRDAESRQAARPIVELAA
jgi:methionyl-tRNA formyltransferase